MANKKPKANDPGPSPPAGHPMRVESVPIETVHPDPSNVRRHPARNLDAIRASLARFGQQKPIVVDPKGIIRAGNGTYEAAKSLGWPDIRVVRTDLAGSEATAYSIADNRSADLAEWDDTALAETLRSLQSEDFDLAAVGYEDAEVDALLEKIAAEHAGPLESVEDPGPRVDHAAELQEKWQTARGQLWSIASTATPGKAHRLLCGDSTNADDVARLMGDDRAVLMNTDPPYGVSYDVQDNYDAANATDGTHRVSRYGAVENDDLVGERLQGFLENAIKAAVPILSDRAAFYLWHPMLTQGTFFAAAAAAADILIHRQIIWVKPHFIFGRGDYHWKHELCFYGWRRGYRPPFYGERNQDTVWVLETDGLKDHPTQKPVELFVRPILNHTRRGEVVYEPFAGSGSQFVAAEQTGRLCHGTEIDPKYCAVVLDRLSGMGLTPELLA